MGTHIFAQKVFMVMQYALTDVYMFNMTPEEKFEGLLTG